MIKRLITLIPFLAIFSHSTHAYDELLKNSNYTENNRRKMYLKANVGAGLLNDTKDSASNLKMTSKAVPYFAVGAGTYFMDNTRVDLTFEHAANPALKKSSTSSLNNFAKTNIGQTIINNFVNQASSVISNNNITRLLGYQAGGAAQTVYNNALSTLQANPTSVKNLGEVILQEAIKYAVQTGSTSAAGQNFGTQLIQRLSRLQNNASTQDLYYLLTQDLSTINISTSVNHKATVNTFMVNGAVDLYEFNKVKLFIGAGLGGVQLKEKVTVTSTLNLNGKNSIIIDQSTSTKKANNFAYSLTAGTSAKISDKVTMELAYSWKDFGKTKSAKIQSIEVGKTPYRSHTITAGIRVDI